MDVPTENNKLISRYIKEELSGQELKSFKQRMEDDPDFAEEVAFVENYYKYKEREELRAIVNNFHAKKKAEGFFDKETESEPEEKEETKSNVRWLRPAMAVAAALIGALVLWAFWPFSVGETGTPVANSILKTPVNIPDEFIDFREVTYTFINTDKKNPIDSLKAARIAYSEGNYKEAARLFAYCKESLEKKDLEAEVDVDVAFYLAKSYLLMQPPKLEEGISILESISVGISLKEEIILNRAAAYIVKGDKDKALEYLREHQKGNEEFSNKLDALIKEARQ